QRIFWKDRDSRYLGCNMAFARDAGLAYTEQVIGKTDRDMPWGELADALRKADEEVIATGVPKMNHEFEVLIDGVHRAGITSKLPLTNGDGTVIGVLGSYTDVTDRKRSDLALRLQSRALDASVNAILITAAAESGHVVEYANPAFKRITGYDPAEVIGQDCRFLQRDDHDQEGLVAIREGLAANKEVSAVLRNYRKDGVLFWNQLFIAPVPNPDGNTTHHIGVINDVTDLIRYQEQLEYQANYDNLTRLPNRNLLRERLDQAIARRKPLAVVFIDLDGFKNVNDTYGHEAGDELLCSFGRRLKSVVPDAELVVRMGGDEFAVLVSSPTRADRLEQLCSLIVEAAAEPFHVVGVQSYVAASVGAFRIGPGLTSPGEAVRKADTGLYEAKRRGKGRYCIYSPDLDASLIRRKTLEKELRDTLARGTGLRCVFQPLVEGSEGRIVGVEALARWESPSLGVIPPSQFIPIAEEAGLIAQLGEWVLREGCREMAAWNDIFLAVNVSSIQLRNMRFAGKVLRILEEEGFPPDRLELEITETAIIHVDELVTAQLQRLRAAGVRISVDDFGTGYSSLQLLKELKLDKIKIDQSFVSFMTQAADSAAIVSAFTQLGNALGLQVVAEGVETVEQKEFLIDVGCTGFQGFLFSRPLEAAPLSTLLQGAASLEEN
ncbi:MAG TPA: EAL domain-containing protein, partial [Oxalicibacterium sp.]|nr:EAL domain-containing protein [Oxalicibacterium sp.]